VHIHYIVSWYKPQALVAVGTRFVGPPFLKFSNSSLLWDVFIINSVEQLQTLAKTQSEIDISPFLKTEKKVEDRGGVHKSGTYARGTDLPFF
jgi:hypothetical protein